MRILHTLPELRLWRAEQTRPVGFVPTMGYLHDGHLALVHRARQDGDPVLVSIFVNPTQFGPNEDLASYPRDLDQDLALCEKAGTAAVYAPSAEDVYYPDATTTVQVGLLDRHLCGPHRPGHFQGVATVVAKLFHRVQPQRAYFGEKDFQQLQIIKRMVRDLDFPLEIVSVPTVRERDGLAMSSRNARLSPPARQQATAIYRALQAAAQAVVRGERDPQDAIRQAQVVLAEAGIDPQYLELVNADDLQRAERPLRERVVLAVAATVGGVRLIDNMVIQL